MLEKFEKIAHKARFDKDEFYREVFTPSSLAILSKISILFYLKLNIRSHEFY